MENLEYKYCDRFLQKVNPVCECEGPSLGIFSFEWYIILSYHCWGLRKRIVNHCCQEGEGMSNCCFLSSGVIWVEKSHLPMLFGPPTQMKVKRRFCIWRIFVWQIFVWQIFVWRIFVWRAPTNESNDWSLAVTWPQRQKAGLLFHKWMQ